MTLQASGQISMDDIRFEIYGDHSTGNIILNDQICRTLAGVPNGAISLSDFYGKTWAVKRRPSSATKTSSGGDLTNGSNAYDANEASYAAQGAVSPAGAAFATACVVEYKWTGQSWLWAGKLRIRRALAFLEDYDPYEDAYTSGRGVISYSVNGGSSYTILESLGQITPVGWVEVDIATPVQWFDLVVRVSNNAMSTANYDGSSEMDVYDIQFVTKGA